MSDKCNSCNHIEVCGDNVVDFGCHYEPKRVKCDDCIIGLEHDYEDGTTKVYESCKYLNDEPFTYCPKCGTRIEVK